MRRIHAVLLGVITLIVAVLAGQPAQALAPTVITGGGNYLGPANVLQVFFEGDSTVKTVKATLKPERQPDRPSTLVTEFTLARDGVNTVASSAPVNPGHYDKFLIEVEAADTDGNKIEVRDDAFFDYSWLIRPTLELTATPSTLDIDHQVATIRGVATGTLPMGEPAGALANRTVRAGLSGAEQPLTTDAQGRFTTRTDPPTSRAAMTFSAGINSLQVDEVDLGSGSGFAQIAIRPAATRLSAKADKPRVLAGKNVVVSGLLEQKSGDGWKPLAGQVVTVGTTQATTDAAGRYKALYTMRRTERPMARFGLTDVGADTEIFHLGTQSLAERVVVPVPTSFSRIQVRLDPKGKVEARGSFHGGDPAVKSPLVQLEFSPNGTRDWAVKKTLKVRSGSFVTTFQHRRAGYWRVVFKGDFDHLRGASKVHKTWRWGTWVSKIKASPTRVRIGGRTTVSGRLTRRWNSQQPKATAFPNQSVRIIFRFRGQSTWYHLGWAKTNRSGNFAGRVKANGDGYYAAVFHGTPGTWAADSPNKVYVDTTR